MEIWNPLGNAMHGVEGAREFLRENEQMAALVEQAGPARIDCNPVAVDRPRPPRSDLGS
jgi:hypothetical protein